VTPLAVVVPNYNGADFLSRCLDAVLAQSLPVQRVLVVDNASTDGSGDALATSHPTVQVLNLPVNTGFAGGANAGVRAVDEPFVAVLNSDAEPAPDWHERLVTAPQEDDIWAWGGILVAADTGLVESAADCYHPQGYAFKALRGKPLSALPSEPYEVFAPPGAAPVFRREVFLALGGYDERFFLYYEDIDLCFRAALRGHRAVVVPTAHVRHLGGASGQPARSWWHIGRNSLWTAVRDQPSPGVLALTRRTLREGREARRRGFGGPYLRGRAAGVLGLRGALVARREIQADTTVSPAELAQRLGVPPELRGR
jgi:N-acetylglucosaminyl-diphospho-decaprenol L-rhamnosyltransferase